MMYFSTFITGLQEVVESELKTEIKDIKIKKLLDGLVIYETNKNPQDIKKIRYLNNTFVLFRFYEKQKSMQSLLKDLLGNPDMLSGHSVGISGQVSSFRVITSKENQFVSVDRRLLVDVENLVSRKLRLEVNRTLPDVEFWLLTRSEGFSLIGLRFTKNANHEKTLHKGELRPELAHIMCLLAELKPTDIVLDSFAGYGSIPFECAKYFNVERIYVSEKDKQVFKLLQAKAKPFKPKVVVGKWDALNLKSLTNNTVNKIITDPPWGMYKSENEDIETFYESMLLEFDRLLKPNGLFILLTAQKDVFETLINDFHQFALLKKYDVLVSGKKASIYKVKRI